MDPITFSIIRHRLYRVVDEAVITLKHVSGSAITNEGHDLMVSLYRADGSLLMGGVGFLHHLTSAAEACKSIIRRFEGNINEGDVFLLNDPYTAALHTSDIYLVSPIHYHGELVAWSACFVHVYDIGATNPGGFCPDAPDIYTEGFSSPGIRIVSGGVMNNDVMDTLLNMVRSPEMVALDMSSMIACNNVAKDRMLALIEKYGHDTVDEACRTLIDQSEELLRARLGELPDGEWRSRQYIDVQGEVFKVVLTMTKKDDTLTFDFTDSSPQSPFAINCTKWASLGGLFAPLFPLLCYDITWNDGEIRPITMIAPEGTIVNCTRPAPVSVATVGAIQSPIAGTTVGENPTTCVDARCTSGGNTCAANPVLAYCCGDGVCEDVESAGNCAADCTAPVPAEAGQVTDMMVITGFDDVTGTMSIQFGVPCSAADHTIEFSELTRANLETWNWIGQECSLGTSGTYDWATAGTPTAMFFVVVPNNGTSEGSYGRSTYGAERSEDALSATCPMNQDLVYVCQ